MAPHILVEAKEKDKALAVGMAGMVNSKYLPLLDYDKKAFGEVVSNVAWLQQTFNLHQCSVYKTTNGYHARFFYDPHFTFEQVLKIVQASDSDSNYKRLVKKTGRCINRVSGKYCGNDICHVTDLGAKPTDDYSVKVGDSVKNLFEIMHRKRIVPLDFLLLESENI